MKGIVLCAGLGQRFEPYTHRVPKPSLPFLKAPMMSYPYHYLSQCDEMSAVVINTHHLCERMKDVAQKTVTKHELKVSEEKDLLLTGGGIVKASSFFPQEDTFFIINGDTIFLHKDEAILNKILKLHQSKKRDCTLILTDSPYDKNFSFSPLWYDSQSMKVSFKEKDSYKKCLYIGAMILSKKHISQMPQDRPFHIFKEGLFSSDHTFGYYDPEFTWFETGNLDSYVHSSLSVSRLLKENSGFLKTFPHKEIFSCSDFQEEDFKKMLDI